MRVELVLLLGAFAAGTLVALAFGAANLGTAMTFGILLFMGTLIWVLMRRP